MIALAKQLSARDPLKIRQALLAAMAVESNFRNINYGDRDSQGVLQQRPSQGWGAPGNPAQDINQFLARARRLRGFQGSPGALAQAIQRSAFPGRYDQRMRQVNELLGGATPSVPLPAPGGSPQPQADKLAQIRAIFGQKDQSLLQTVMALQAAQGAQTPPGGPVSPSQPPAPPMQAGGGYNPVELFYDPLGAWKNGQAIAPIGGHSDHVHAAFQNPAQVRQAIALARRLGLRVSENPLVDHVDPVHVKGSYHYRRLAPGVGAAIDVSGAPAKMAALYRALSPRRK